VSKFVIDASIAVKWVVEEDGTAEALTLRQRAKLIAPELLIAECANILWKKVRLDELSKAEALTAARLLQAADIELLPMRFLFEATTRMSIEIDHPAYDCIYVVMAVENKCQFVTADQRLLRKLAQNRTLRKSAISLIEVIKPKD
jgi:predicted nucleic acid-binding protein